MKKIILPDFWPRIGHSVRRIATGGGWAAVSAPEARSNLKWFWFDGLFAAASDKIILTYLTLYVLALGATGVQIGYMTSLASLCAALMLLPGAALVERLGQRQKIAVFSGGISARLMLLLLALIPLLFSGSVLVYVAVGLVVVREAFANLAFPAWMSLTADIVPVSIRGRYFGSRNFIMGVAGMVIAVLVGILITRTGQPSGYQIALSLAFFLGLASTFAFSKLREPLNPQLSSKRGAFAFQALIKDLRQHPDFLKLSAVVAVWNFSLNVAAPFFNVYLVKNLQATAAMVGVISVASTISNLLVQQYMGSLADRWGPRRLQMITGFIIPVLPLLWVFIRSPWHVIPINLLGGVLWAGYSLAGFNFILVKTPEDQRARFSAIYQIVVTLSLAAGAAFGGLILSWGSFYAVFIGSCVGRLLAASMYARIVHS